MAFPIGFGRGTGSLIPQDNDAITCLISDFTISRDKILSIIRSLNSKKAHGWDETSVSITKLSYTTSIISLKITFKNCLRRGVFPKIWKCANVVPIDKKNKKYLKENHRSISLLPMFGKILEKLVYYSLYSHLASSTVIDQNQSGFRKGNSTPFQNIYLYSFA